MEESTQSVVYFFAASKAMRLHGWRYFDMIQYDCKHGVGNECYKAGVLTVIDNNLETKAAAIWLCAHENVESWTWVGIDTNNAFRDINGTFFRGPLKSLSDDDGTSKRQMGIQYPTLEQFNCIFHKVLLSIHSELID